MRVVDIIPLQEPFDFGLDGDGRAQYAFNVMATTYQNVSESFVMALVALLVSASVGKYAGTGANILVSSKSVVPAGAGPFIGITATGGAGPLKSHGSSYQRPSAQLLVRATSAIVAESKARAAYAALDAVRNADVTPTVP